MSDNDDELTLSAEATAALLEFYIEQQNKEDKQAENENIDEDWQLSQFWYDDATAATLANEALRLSGPKGSIACVSCPTVYKKLRSLKEDSDTQWSAVQLRLLEYDPRFVIYGDDFVRYDYKEPLNVYEDVLVIDYDVVIVDPPFLSEECLTKTMETVKRLTTHKIILCTGAVMEEIAAKLPFDLKVCNFEPKHERNLGNEFKCYANYDLDSYVK